MDVHAIEIVVKLESVELSSCQWLSAECFRVRHSELHRKIQGKITPHWVCVVYKKKPGLRARTLPIEDCLTRDWIP